MPDCAFERGEITIDLAPLLFLVELEILHPSPAMTDDVVAGPPDLGRRLLVASSARAHPATVSRRPPSRNSRANRQKLTRELYSKVISAASSRSPAALCLAKLETLHSDMPSPSEYGYSKPSS